MILLLGGTTETPKIANLLAESNCKVLISNLTESSVEWDLSGEICFRQGELDINSMSTLLTKEGITAIVDAGHPYSQELHNNAIEICSRMNVPYYRYERPGINFADYEVEFVDNHQNAAIITFELGNRILLTTGSRNLEPYVEIMRETDKVLYVRILPCQESFDVCNNYAIDKECIIAERGPFTVEQNIEVIKKYSIDVLVTKDSGVAGGVLEKLRAARDCGVRIVVITKPTITYKTGESFEDILELVKKVTCLYV